MTKHSQTTWKPLSNETKPLTFLLALTFLISGSTTVSAKPKSGDYEGAIYVRNYDGDTITFNLPNLHPIIGKNIRVRLNGIDTPEIKGKCDKEKYDAEQALHGASLPREFERQDGENLKLLFHSLVNVDEIRNLEEFTHIIFPIIVNG